MVELHKTHFAGTLDLKTIIKSMFDLGLGWCLLAFAARLTTRRFFVLGGDD